MLLSFPVRRVHNFGQHFGSTEIRHSIVRHTFVAGPETGGVEKIVRIDALSAIPGSSIVENDTARFLPPAIVSEVPTYRILQHLKLGHSRSGTSDPLI